MTSKYYLLWLLLDNIMENTFSSPKIVIKGDNKTIQTPNKQKMEKIVQ